MRQRYSWDELIPVEEAHTAAKFLATTWNLVTNLYSDDFQYKRHEPKLTERLHYYLIRFKAKSGLTGFWVNEGQESYVERNGSFKKIRKDITYCSNISMRLELIFEFKKVSKSTLATYRGNQGMRRFIDGNYAPHIPLAVMVGIMLKNGSKDVIQALYSSLSKIKVRSQLQMVSDTSGRYIRRPSEALQAIAEFDTEHIRPPEKAPPNGTTTIAHIFLFCNK